MDEIIPPLNAAEVRVLSALIEKAVTTPEYYPLSLGALTNACNQLSNRDPVVSFEESDVTRSLDALRAKRLVTQFHGADNRVAKYKHGLTDILLLTPAELAVLCVLMLRGPQTLGELRTRTERLYKFAALTDVEETLVALSIRQPRPLVTKLPRQFGLKEARYAHLFSGQPDSTVEETASSATIPPPRSPDDKDRIAKLEDETASLRSEVEVLKQQVADLKRQWE
ncbi:MAG: YceH family protein [Opitutaceae bacterium]